MLLLKKQQYSVCDRQV